MSAVESTATRSGDSGSVVFLSGDLMFASRVRGAAQQANWLFRLGTSLPEDQTESIRLVILDLSTRSGLLPHIVTQCQNVCPGARLIAYGPHVQVDRLRAAREAGIETVLTRGQFDGVLTTLFGQPDE